MSPTINSNVGNNSAGAVVVGYLNNLSDASAPWDYIDPSKFNAVKVRISKRNSLNGEIPFFFHKIQTSIWLDCCALFKSRGFSSL